VPQRAADDATRLLVVTPGNIRQSHLYVRGLYDFFPRDCIGPSRKSKTRNSHEIEIHLDGLNEVVRTDIGVTPSTGKPRSFFRGRAWVRRFFQHHGIAPGDQLAIERLGERSYRLFRFEPNGRPRFKAAEFFAGIGLVRLALERQNWEVVFANDIDPAKAEMYRHNWPGEDHLHVGDIHKLRADDVPTCDLFTASFPCNDLSIAGRWEGLSGKESSAFWGFTRLIRDLGRRAPRLVMLENVVGFLQRHKGRDFAEALTALNDLGYAVDAVILNAVHWTPQSRARLFVIGRRGISDPASAIPWENDARPLALCRFINSHPEINWALQRLPALPKPCRRLSDVVEDLPDDDSHWWSRERVDYFMGQLSKRHGDEAQRLIADRTVTYATAFRRVRHGRSMAELRTDGIAGCLRTPRGGSGRQILVKAGRGRIQVRLLTARECARLQGVPDSYRIEVPLNQALFGFGDAVCIPAVEWVIQHCLRHSAKVVRTA
jgi:DNA (cytosine-5)-methyltransferase 1